MVRSFLLEPRGKVRAIAWVCIGEDEILLISQQAALLAETLSMYRIRVKVDIPLLDIPVLVEVGTGFGSAWTGTPSGFVAGSDRYRFHGGSTETVSMDGSAFALARILLGEPEVGSDLDEKSMVHESPLVSRSVAFAKGCYLGQELVSRIETRGRSNQRSVRIEGNGPIPDVGTDVAIADRAVGRITTVAPVGTGYFALAMVRREAEDGSIVVIAGADAVVHELPTQNASSVDASNA